MDPFNPLCVRDAHFISSDASLGLHCFPSGYCTAQLAGTVCLFGIPSNNTPLGVYIPHIWYIWCFVEIREVATYSNL